jgi:DNA-binding MarR family transcriptional regulator
MMGKINLIGRCAATYRGERFEGLELGAYQQSYLFMICRNPGISQEQLAKWLWVNKSNVTRSMVQLEETGYVERRQSESDRRITQVYPTERALEALPQVRAICREWNDYLTADFSEEERQQLDLLLTRMTARARAFADSGTLDGPVEDAEKVRLPSETQPEDASSGEKGDKQ